MSDMNLFFHNFQMILIYGMILYCFIGIIMYICTSKKKKARDIMLLQTIGLIIITILFIRGFGAEQEIIRTFRVIKDIILGIFT